MKRRLLWKLLFINIIPVIAVIILVVWFAVDQLAAKYFMALMSEYDVSPTDIHQMFLTAIHRYLLWASFSSLAVAFILSFLLTRRVLQPLSAMSRITKNLARGDFRSRVEIGSQDEVGQLGLAFNRMADSLEQLEQLRKNMVVDIAHELRTPLTNLRGYLEALHDDVLPPSKETFQMLQQEILRLVHLVENLQQLARAEAAKVYLNREELQLPAMVDQIIAIHDPVLQEKKIIVSTQYDLKADTVIADREKILQAMGNLMENALKYTPSEGRITISTEMLSDGVKVNFTNTGISIADADLPFIFERFFRADRSRSREGGGAGIGLAIVKELIEAHGGRIGAESSSNATSIWFILPS